MLASACGRVLGRLADVAMLVAICGWLAPNAWIARAAAGRTYLRAADVPARTFAIVPGSRVYRDKPHRLLRDRLDAALTLYQTGRVRAVLVSGTDTDAAPEASVMQQWLIAHGVPAGDILVDGQGTRTRETMVRAVARYGVADAVVCTQTVNVARTVFLARQAGIDAVALALPIASLEHSSRYLAVESLKTTLAFAESLRPSPVRAATVLAAR
ncbi:MAG TPA: ElyC/SanA/YdcF family protein [Polyangia bacterium]|nr:ElyC/SanA/YdcF family protein [Polyangia bacterium]